jgi:pimeloyl-ACP methyl ester carboxylesterase
LPTIEARGVELHWAERGDPDGRPLVLVHGLLLSSRMFERLARRLSHRRLVLVDVRGHGGSTRFDDAEDYTWRSLADDVVTVLDAVGLDRSVVGGTSLGADVALATAAHHRDRVAGLLLEMPVLSDSEPFARRVFGPASTVLRVTAPVLAPCTRAIGRLPLPRRPPELAMLRDAASADPRAASALLRGLLDSERPDVAVVGTQPLPALVIGHARDPLHALADAHHVADVLPSSELHESPSFLHYRFAVSQLASLVDGWLLRNDL